MLIMCIINLLFYWNKHLQLAIYCRFWKHQLFKERICESETWFQHLKERISKSVRYFVVFPPTSFWIIIVVNACFLWGIFPLFFLWCPLWPINYLNLNMLSVMSQSYTLVLLIESKTLKLHWKFFQLAVSLWQVNFSAYSKLIY